MARIRGTRENDVLAGTQGNDRIFAGKGDDLVIGGKGNDRMKGGEGQDTFRFNAGDGNDRILDFTQEDRIEFDFAESDVTIRETSKGTFISYEGGSVFVKGVSASELNLSFAEPPVTPEPPFTPVSPEPVTGEFALRPREDGERPDSSLSFVSGTNGDDILQATNTAYNWFLAGEGEDTLIASDGYDLLQGDGGFYGFGPRFADKFVFETLSSSGPTVETRDTIFGFDAGLDKIDVSAIDANSTTPGDDAFEFIGTADFSGTAGELRVTEVIDFGALGDRLYVEADVNGDGVSDFSIEVAASVIELHPLSTEDFIL